jgi:SAM-dependent methyltransferase
MEARSFGTWRVVTEYSRRSGIEPAEVAALGSVWSCVEGGRVLDVGVGTGRTTRFLRRAAASYRAIDVMPAMVAAFRRQFPDVDIDVGDARALVGHADGAYTLVYFSFNGIDYVAPEERSMVLAEALRVLAPGGAFVYSSHSLGALGGRLPVLHLPGLSLTSNPLRLAARSARAASTAVRCVRNRRRLGRAQRWGDGWAVVNDDAHDYSLLTTYVDPEREVEALVRAGFAPDVRRFGRDGAPYQPGGADAWVHYVARRPG